MIGVPENKMRIVAPEVGGRLRIEAQPVRRGSDRVTPIAQRLRAAGEVDREPPRERHLDPFTAAISPGIRKCGEKRTGTLLAIRARSVADLGAYNQLLTPAIPTLTGSDCCAAATSFKALRMDLQRRLYEQDVHGRLPWRGPARGDDNHRAPDDLIAAEPGWIG